MPEPMHISGPQHGDEGSATGIDVRFSIGSDGDDDSPTLEPEQPDPFDSNSPWKSSPHTPIRNLTTPQQPKATKRHRQTVALLEEFNATFLSIQRVFQGLPHQSQHWTEVMIFYHKARSFSNEDTDQYFYYKDGSRVATDADFECTKQKVDELMKEWKQLQDALQFEGVSLDEVEEGQGAVPQSFV